MKHLNPGNKYFIKMTWNGVSDYYMAEAGEIEKPFIHLKKATMIDFLSEFEKVLLSGEFSEIRENRSHYIGEISLNLNQITAIYPCKIPLPTES